MGNKVGCDFLYNVFCERCGKFLYEEDAKRRALIFEIVIKILMCELMDGIDYIDWKLKR